MLNENNMNYSFDPKADYMLRWRGRQQGPFTLEQVERKLEENAIGMLHEIKAQNQWMTLRAFLDLVEAERRAEAERLAAIERAAAAALALNSEIRGRTPADQFNADTDRNLSKVNQAGQNRIDVSDCFKKAWQLIIKNPVETIIGFLMVNFLAGIMLAIYWGVLFLGLGSFSASIASKNLVVLVLSIICFIAISLIYYLVFGALLGGLWHLFLKIARGESGSLGDLFAGFKIRLLDLGIGLLLPQLVSSFVFLMPLIIYFEILIFLYFTTTAVYSFSNLFGGTSLFFTGLFFWVGLILTSLISLIFLTYYFLTRFLFVSALIIDKKISFLKATAASVRHISVHFWSMLGLVLLAIIIALSGSLFFGVGIIFTYPLAFMSLAVAYTVVFDSVDIHTAVNHSDNPSVSTSKTNYFTSMLGIGLAVILLLGAALLLIKYR